MTRCEVEPELRPVETDHYPIITELSLNPDRLNLPPKRNFRMTNWEKFTKHLEEQTRTIAPPLDNIQTTIDLENRLDQLANAIQSTVDACVPLCKPSPFSKRWWAAELDELNANVKRLSQKANKKRQQPSHPVHAELKNARNTLSTDIRKAKEEHWIEHLESVEGANAWSAYKYLISEPSDFYISRIPSLRANNTSPPPANRQTKTKAECYTKPFSRPHQTDARTSKQPPTPTQSATSAMTKFDGR